MRRWWLVAIGVAACGSAQPAIVPVNVGDLKPWATECTIPETFVEAGDSALEGVIVDCLTGERMPGVDVFAAGADADRRAISDASGRYHLQLPEGRYRLLAKVQDDEDNHDLGEIEVRPQHVTVKEIRLDFPRCPRTGGHLAAAAGADRDALIAAVLDHHAANGIVDAPSPSEAGPTYVTVKKASPPALPSSHARQYAVTTEDNLQDEATRSGRDIRFIHVFGIDVAGACATVSVGGDIVFARQQGMIKMCCCQETEVFLRSAGRWAFRTSSIGICI